MYRAGLTRSAARTLRRRSATLCAAAGRQQRRGFPSYATLPHRKISSFLKPLAFTAGTAGVCFSTAALAPAHLIPNVRLPAWAIEMRHSLEDLGLPRRLLHSMAGAVIIANVAVFCAWRVAPGARVLHRVFLQRPSENRALPLLFSSFSHMSPMHLGFNMYAFWSFSAPVAAAVGGANTLALYLSASVASSFFSTVVRNALPALRQSTHIHARFVPCGVSLPLVPVPGGQNDTFSSHDFSSGLPNGVRPSRSRCARCFIGRRFLTTRVP